MKHKKKTNYFVKYYKKEVDTLLTHLNKAKNVSNENNIHQLRVDIKRIKAVFQLLELIFPKELKIQEYNSSLKKLYRIAGEIREVQINRICFSKFKFSKEIVSKYNQFLKNKEVKFRNKFEKVADDFDSNLFMNSKKQIKKLSSSINNEKIQVKCISFINGEIHEIEQLISAGENTLIFHRIRMHIKALNFIVSLLITINPTKEVKNIMALLKQNGSLIGEWHDKTILIDSLERFFIKKENIAGNKYPLFIKMLDKIKSENHFILKEIKSGMRILIKIIKKTNIASYSIN